jgi:hypothetical protein
MNSDTKESSLDILKAKLTEFIAQSSITIFESDDIVELVKEGETIAWIVDQMRNNSPSLDVPAATALLTEIKALIKPVEIVAEAKVAEVAIEENMPDLSQVDLSQLDLSQLADSLPPDIKLPPGVDMKQIQDLMASPQGQIMSDFLLFCQEKGVELNEDAMNDPRIQKLQREWESTPRAAFDGQTPSEMRGNNPGLMPAKVETFRREEPRVGRNDPCPCGSGKKYKKCCGKN